MAGTWNDAVSTWNDTSTKWNDTGSATLHFPMAIVDTSTVATTFHVNLDFALAIVDASTVHLTFHVNLDFAMPILDTSTVAITFHVKLDFPVAIVDTSTVTLGFVTGFGGTWNDTFSLWNDTFTTWNAGGPPPTLDFPLGIVDTSTVKLLYDGVPRHFPVQIADASIVTLGFVNAQFTNTWASNGAQTGGSGAYVPGTQSVNYILANFAQPGDTITIPAGTFVWSSTTSVSIPITLQGVNPGVPGNTAAQSAFASHIQNNLAAGPMLYCVAPATGHITIKYLCFEQIVGNTSGYPYCISLDRTDVNTAGTAFIVSPYTCILQDCYLTPNNNADYMVVCVANGIIISRCTIVGGYGVNTVCTKYNQLMVNTPNTIGRGPTTNGGVGDSVNGGAGVAGLNNTYVETCTLVASSAVSNAGAVVNADANSRLVFRYNTVIDSECYIHGGTSEYPNIHTECYNCTFLATNPGFANDQCWLTIRSGQIIITGNTWQEIPGKQSIVLFLEQLNRSAYAEAGQTVYPSGWQIGWGYSAANATVHTQQTGTLNGTTTVTGLNTSTIYTGAQVSGTNIPAGCVVQSLVSPTSITLSAAATGSGSVTLTFTGIPFGFPPMLGGGSFGSASYAPNMGYGQAIAPIYIWNNTGAGNTPAAGFIEIDQYSPDGYSNNLTVAGTIYFNQQASANGSGTSISATFSGAIDASVAFGSWHNDLLLCMLSWTTGSPTNPTPQSVTDGTNSWQQIGGIYTAPTGESQALFAAINSGNTCTYTVVAHFSSSASGLCMNIADYAGNWTAVNQLHAITTDGSTANASAATNNLSSGNITTSAGSAGNDLIIAWAKSGSVPTTVSAGWTTRAYDGTNNFGFYDNIGAGSGGSFATPGTFQLSATTAPPWAISAVAFQSQPFLANGRDFVQNTPMPGWLPFTYPHPLAAWTLAGDFPVLVVDSSTVLVGFVLNAHFPIQIVDASTVTLGFERIVPLHFGMPIVDTSTVRLGFEIIVPGHFQVLVVDTSTVTLGFHAAVLDFPVRILDTSSVLLGFDRTLAPYVPPPPQFVPNPVPPYAGEEQPALIEVNADIAWRESEREEGPWVMPPYEQIYPQPGGPAVAAVPPPLSKVDIWNAQQTWPE